MKKVVREFKVFSFNELSKDSQEKAISDYIDFMVQTTDFESISKNSNLYKAYKKANEMQTIWFLGSYIWDMCEGQIMKELKNDYFLENGKVFVLEDNDIVKD